MEEMKIERAIEILNPEHREKYESIAPVNEACEMGVQALRRRIAVPLNQMCDGLILLCPSCGSGKYLYNEDGLRNSFCGQCGQAIK